MDILTFATRSMLRSRLPSIIRISCLGLTGSLMMAWSSLTGGFVENIYHGATSLESGDYQIHHNLFLSDPSPYHLLKNHDQLLAKLLATGVKASSRIYGAGLLANDEDSLGIQIIALNPRREGDVTSLTKHLARGSWLGKGADNGEKDVIVGSRVAQNLALNIGDRLIFMGQGFDGSIASNWVRVLGILKPISDDADSRLVLMGIPDFRELFSLSAGVHEIILRDPGGMVKGDGFWNDLIKDNDQKSEIQLVSWEARRPVLASMLKLLSFTTTITLFVVYLAVGFLTLNTMLATILSRMPTYRTLTCLGTLPKQIFFLVMAEACVLSLCAAVVAILLGVPIVYYLKHYGIDFSGIVQQISFAGINLSARAYGAMGPSQILTPLVFLLMVIPLASLLPALKAKNQDNLPNGI